MNPDFDTELARSQPATALEAAVRRILLSENPDAMPLDVEEGLHHVWGNLAGAEFDVAIDPAATPVSNHWVGGIPQRRVSEACEMLLSESTLLARHGA